jgi:hypothetical protein
MSRNVVAVRVAPRSIASAPRMPQARATDTDAALVAMFHQLRAR